MILDMETAAQNEANETNEAVQQMHSLSFLFPSASYSYAFRCVCKLCCSLMLTFVIGHHNYGWYGNVNVHWMHLF